jgi:hypothetical protein
MVAKEEIHTTLADLVQEGLRHLEAARDAFARIDHQAQDFRELFSEDSRPATLDRGPWDDEAKTWVAQFQNLQRWQHYTQRIARDLETQLHWAKIIPEGHETSDKN